MVACYVSYDPGGHNQLTLGFKVDQGDYYRGKATRYHLCVYLFRWMLSWSFRTGKHREYHAMTWGPPR